MSYKDLLVVLDSASDTRGRIEVAASLAEKSAAHLVGLYPIPSPTCRAAPDTPIWRPSNRFIANGGNGRWNRPKPCGIYSKRRPSSTE